MPGVLREIVPDGGGGGGGGGGGAQSVRKCESHQILLSRLNSVFGIQSTALQWFHSYLSDRYQSTSVNNSSSSPSQLMYGVPQGSHWGPFSSSRTLHLSPIS